MTTRKTVPAKSSLSVVKSPRLPDKPEPHDYSTFDQFTRLGDELHEMMKYFEKNGEQIYEMLEAGNTPAAWYLKRLENDVADRPRWVKKAANFQRMESYFGRDELYEEVDVDDDGLRMWQIKTEVV